MDFWNATLSVFRGPSEPSHSNPNSSPASPVIPQKRPGHVKVINGYDTPTTGTPHRPQTPNGYPQTPNGYPAAENLVNSPFFSAPPGVVDPDGGGRGNQQTIDGIANAETKHTLLPLQLVPGDTITCLTVQSDSVFIGLSSGDILEYTLVADQWTHSRTFDFPRERPEPTSNPADSSAITSASALALTHRRLYVGYMDGCITIFNRMSGTPIRSIAAAHMGPVTALCCYSAAMATAAAAASANSGGTGNDPSSASLFSGGKDGVLNEWDAKSLRKKSMLQGHDAQIEGVVAGGGRVYSGAADKKVKGWDISSGRCLADFGNVCLTPVVSVALGRDLLYLATSDGLIQVVDTSSGQTLRTLQSPTGAHGLIRALCLANGKLYCAADDGSVEEWDVKKAAVVRGWKVPAGCVGIAGAADGKVVVACHEAVAILRHDTVKNDRTRPQSLFVGAAAGVMEYAGNIPPTPPLSTPTRYEHAEIRPGDSISNGPYDSPHRGTEYPHHRDENQESATVTKLKHQLHRLTTQLATAQHASQQSHSQLTSLQREHASLLSTLTHLRTRAEDAEDELLAAKDLLISYKEELELTQLAHETAFSYLKQSANRTWFDCEREIRGLKEMIDNPPTPLVVHEDLSAFLPGRKVGRCWDRDSEWDSDVDDEMSEAAPGDDDDDDDEGGGAVWEKQQERVTRTPWWRDLPGGSNSVGVVKEVGQLKWYRERAASAAEPVLPVDEGSAGDDDQSSEDSDAGSDGDDDADEMGEDGGSDAEHAEDALTTATARVKAHRPVTVKSTHRLPDGGVVVNTFSPTLPHRRSALSRGATVVGLPIPDVHSNVNGNPTHARPPVRRNTTTSHLAHGGGAGVNPGGMSKTLHRASSWFKPIQSWVETIGEVIAPTPSPDDQSQGRRTSVIDGGSGSLRRMPQPLLQNRARANSAVAVPRPYIVDTALSHPPPSPPANPQPHQLPHPLPRTYSAVSVASSKASSGATPGEEGKRQGGKKIRVRRCDVYQFDEAVGHADGAAKGDAATAPEPLGDSKDRSGAPTHDSRETRTDTSPPQPVSPPGTTPIPSTPPRESNADNGDPKPEDDFGEFESPVVDSPPPRRAETDAATE